MDERGHQPLMRHAPGLVSRGEAPLLDPRDRAERPLFRPVKGPGWLALTLPTRPPTWFKV